MNIVYTTDDKFVPQVGTGICSVFENNRNLQEITIYIVGQGITQKNKENFQNLAQRYERQIYFIDLKSMEEYLDFTFDTSGWNPIVLARLLLDRLLPSTVDKVLYLDGDTICLGDLQKLWDLDLRGYTLGACIEATVEISRREALGIRDFPYINAGVLLIDLSQWKVRKCTEKVLNYYKVRHGKLFANDQDAINGALKEEILYLPPKYNFYNIYWLYPYKFLHRKMGNAFYYTHKIFTESQKHPIIIHYLGEERPWREGNHHRFRDQYEYYRNLTPWKHQQMEKGWKTYYLCWGIFNKVLKPFPAMRYHIITALIPSFMKWRKKQLSKEKSGRKP